MKTKKKQPREPEDDLEKLHSAGYARLEQALIDADALTTGDRIAAIANINRAISSLSCERRKYQKHRQEMGARMTEDERYERMLEWLEDLPEERIEHLKAWLKGSR